MIGDSNKLKSIIYLLEKMSGVEGVHTFDRFLEAREYIERNFVGLVLLDADDEEAGWEIPHRKIKELNRMIKVVLVSDNDKAAVRAHEEGVWDYLLKPVKERQLERIVKKTVYM